MELLRELPEKNGMAFVIVQHLDPHHSSKLASLLAKATKMPVAEVTRTTKPEPNQVYVQPANKCLIVRGGQLKLVRRTQRINVAIDHFFESLAEDRGARAIAILLSGCGSDGTAGLRAIKEAGGLTFAQSEESARFPEMPRNAIRSGFVDAVLSPRQIAREIRQIAKHPYLRRPIADVDHIYEAADDLGRIFFSLKKQMGVDFSNYKAGTLNRRIQRRMALHRIKTLSQYARFLRDNKKEIQALFDDLLINVTRFFRDARLFTALRERYLPGLLKTKERQSDLRAWVPGCATGEEVYSLAICLLETLGRRSSELRIQIFGTDLSETMIDHARAGIYSNAIEKDVSPLRLKRFFTKTEVGYQIARRVRDVCTFARQDVVTDPPFSRLDLISCRNLLIYLGPDLQKRCIPQFHHALNPGGYLILGPAESVGTFDKLFELADKKNKIYIKQAVTLPQSLGVIDYRNHDVSHFGMKAISGVTPGVNAELLQTADRIMLSAYAPAAVVVDQDLKVHQFRGRTDIYLQHQPGPASLDLLQIVRTSLVADLRNTIRRAIKSNKPARKERAVAKLNGKMLEMNIQVVPFRISTTEKPWLLVIFDETTQESRSVEPRPRLGKSARQREIGELRRELAATKESLQAIIEEQEAGNEELKSANEEIESSNEELQSTNEELETAKEELQSTNEELTTLNEELSTRNLEMLQVNNDLSNLLASLQLPIVMVDNNLIVRRATPAARIPFNILASDVGRPISDLKRNVDIPDLEAIVRSSIDTLASHERPVTGKEGRRYLLRVRPYRTSEDKIDGAVITLIETDGRTKGNESKASKNRRQIARPK